MKASTRFKPLTVKDALDFLEPFLFEDQEVQLTAETVNPWMPSCGGDESSRNDRCIECPWFIECNDAIAHKAEQRKE